jgi:hypothetical protein
MFQQQMLCFYTASGASSSQGDANDGQITSEDEVNKC